MLSSCLSEETATVSSAAEGLLSVEDAGEAEGDAAGFAGEAWLVRNRSLVRAVLDASMFEMCASWSISVRGMVWSS